MAPHPESVGNTVDGKKKNGMMKQKGLLSFFNKKSKSQEEKKASNKPATTSQKSVPKKKINDDDLLSKVKLGCRIEVYWKDDDKWYGAKVTKHRKDHMYYIEYDDDEFEWIDLGHEPFRFVTTSNTKKKRHIQEDDEEEEFQFNDDDSEGEEEYKDDGADMSEDDEDDDQFVTDDDEDQEIASKGVTTKKQKTVNGSAKKTAGTTTMKASKVRRVSSSLSHFSASKVSVTEHNVTTDTKTPTNRSTPKQITPLSSLQNFNQPSPSANASGDASTCKPIPFTLNVINPAGSHVHNHLDFLRKPVDLKGRSPDHPEYDRRTLRLVNSDWEKITGKKMTDAVKQWWDIKSQYFDTVLLFKTGKFYEMFHMDADIGVQVLGLIYMKGHMAHAGFPEISYGSMADKLVRAGYKVARVEQTETPEQMKERKKNSSRGSGPKVVNREVCSVMTIGTRTFCYLDDTNMFEAGNESGVGPLLSIREVLIEDSSQEVTDENNVQPCCEYGITIVDAVRGTITMGQFADDVLRSRMVTLLSAFAPSEILIEGGDNGASPILLSLIRSLQTSQQNFQVERINPIESFPESTAIDPQIKKQLERGTKGKCRQVRPWDVEETLEELHRRKYFPKASKQNDQLSVSRWPEVLRAVVEGQANLALSSFGAALYYLQRNLIDAEILSMGIVKAYVPPDSSVVSERTIAEVNQLAAQQMNEEFGVEGSIVSPSNQSEMEIESTIQSESEVTHMSLDGTTLHNLEILTNSVDYKTAGSLWHKINHTKTPHGARLLRAWLLRPLFRKADIERRLDAVQELSCGAAAVAVDEARNVLSKCNDIERLLSRVHSMSGSTAVDDDAEGNPIHPSDRAVLYEAATYTKRKVGDFSKLLNGLRHACEIPDLFSGIQIESGLLGKIVRFAEKGGCFPDMKEELDWFFSNFNCEKAAKGLFEPSKGIDQYYDDACDTIDRIIAELNDYKEEMCSTVLSPRSLAKTSWKYANVKPESKDKFTIELPARVSVPDYFIMKGKRGSGQKQINKYRTPDIDELVRELERAYDVQKERKAKGMELIFAKFDSKRSMWAAAAHATALLDAISSLAQLASNPEYNRPTILDCSFDESPQINIVKGRHPCVEKTYNEDFIPNDLSLGGSCEGKSAPRVLLLSGPNMGGKSTLLRQTCLITILAQLGSFVPAELCEITPVDVIFTRLGASDRILMNQSTFFVELAEMAAALRGATRRSLVIMDELGRGTSTFDGTALASAAVQHLVAESKCLSMFATHYHSLLEEWKADENVVLGHMECLVEEQDGETTTDNNVTFLYTLGKGVCPKSFGINVAKLAQLPNDILVTAKRISEDFEQEMDAEKGRRAVLTGSKAIQEQTLITDAFRDGSWEEITRMLQQD